MLEDAAAPSVHRSVSDRFLIWPFGFAFLITCVWAILAETPTNWAFGGMFFFTVVVIPIVLLGLAGAAIYFLWKSRWRSLASISSIPVLVFCLRDPIAIAGYYVHLMINRAAYDAEVQTGQEQFAVFDWSTGFAGGPKTFLLYDGRDQIAALSPGSETSDGYGNGFASVCAGNSRHLVGHYYVCVFD